MPVTRGSFDVAIESEPIFSDETGIKLTRNIVRKEFSGGMIGNSVAQMIAAHTATPGSAGYVAIEHFTGSVDGRVGSLLLQHHGLMEKEEATLTVTIIPDSGTGELVGITGGLEIDNDDGKHSYVFEYER